MEQILIFISPSKISAEEFDLSARKGGQMGVRLKTSVSLSVFERPQGMPALFSGGTEKNIKRIKELGYEGVDLFVRAPFDEATKQTLHLLKQYQLEIGAIMPAALAGEGLFLGDANSEIRKEAVQRIGEIIRLAEETDGMVSLGLVRGNKLPEEPLEAFEERFLESCRELLSIAQPLGVALLIEPINRYEINTINSVREGVEFLRRTGLPMYLMVDTFHMNIEDVEIGSELLNALTFTKHIHFLDSNRLAPSMGHLDMEAYYHMLNKAGYEGYLCLEALADKVSSDECAVRGAEFFNLMRRKKSVCQERTQEKKGCLQS